MAKKFNITGKCHPTKHFMANVSGKLAKVLTMVNDLAVKSIAGE